MKYILNICQGKKYYWLDSSLYTQEQAIDWAKEKLISYPNHDKDSTLSLKNKTFCIFRKINGTLFDIKLDFINLGDTVQVIECKEYGSRSSFHALTGRVVEEFVPELYRIEFKLPDGTKERKSFFASELKQQSTEIEQEVHNILSNIFKATYHDYGYVLNNFQGYFELWKIPGEPENHIEHHIYNKIQKEFSMVEKKYNKLFYIEICDYDTFNLKLYF